MRAWFVFLLFSIVGARAGETCSGSTDDNFVVTCSACAAEKTSSINFVKDMPRLNFKGDKITNNLAYYDLYDCETTGSCSLNIELNTSDLLSTSNPPTASANYIQGLSFYAAFGLLLFLAFFIYFIVLLCCRYVCFCCSSGGVACCCRTFPTPKNNADNQPTGDTSCCCGCFGYVRDTSNPQGFSYPAWEKWFSRILAWIFCACTVAFCLAIIFAGSEGLTNGMYDLVESPMAGATMVSALTGPLSSLMATDIAQLVSQITVNSTQVIIDTAKPNLYHVNVQGMNTFGPQVVFPSTFRTNKVLFESTRVPVTTTLGALTLPADSSIPFPGGSLTVWNSHAVPITDVARTSHTGISKIPDLVTASGNLQPIGQVSPLVQDISSGISAWPVFSGSVPVDFDSGSFYAGLNSLWTSATPDYTTSLSLASTADMYTQSTISAAAAAVNTILTAKTTIDTLDVASALSALASLHTDTLIHPDLVTTLAAQTSSPTFSPLLVSAQLAAAESSSSAFIANSIVDTHLNATIDNGDKTVTFANSVFTSVVNVTSILELSQLTPVIDNTQDILANITTTVSTLKNTISTILQAYNTLENTDFNAEINSLLRYYGTAATLNADLVGKDGDVGNIVAFRDAVAVLFNGDNGSNTPTAAQMTSFLTALNTIDTTTLQAQHSALTLLLAALSNDTDAAITQLQQDTQAYVDNANTRVCRGTTDACPTDPTTDPTCVCIFTAGPDETALLQVLSGANVVTEVATYLSALDGSSLGPLSSAPTLINSYTTAITNTNAAAPDASVSGSTLATILADANVQSYIIGPNAFDGVALREALLLTLASAQVDAEAFEGNLQAIVDDVQQYLADYLPLLLDLDALLSAVTTCLPVLAQNIETERLYTIYNAQGLSALWDALIDAIDYTAQCFDTTTSLLPMDANIRNDSMVKDIRKLSERIDPTKMMYGGAHYLMSIVDPDAVLPGDDPTQYRYEEDVNGNPYPDNRKCYTEKCLREEVRRLNYEPLEDVSPLPVPLSRETVTLLPLVFPAIAVLLLLLASLLGLCVAARCDNCITHLANGSLCVMFTYGTLTFLIVSSLFFPLLLATGDTCQSMANVAMKHVVHENVCSTVGGTGNQELCSFEVDKLTFAANPIAISATVLGNHCGPDNGIQEFWRSSRTEAMRIPDLYVRDRLNDPSDAFFGVMRGSMRAVMDQAVDNMAGMIANTVDNVSNTLSCDLITASLASVTEAMCCSTANALYWVICGYYLCAWAILFCGVPSALLGRKRFRNSLWGPLVLKHQEMYGSEHKSQNGLCEAVASEEGLPLTEHGIVSEGAVQATQRDAESVEMQQHQQQQQYQQYNPNQTQEVLPFQPQQYSKDGDAPPAYTSFNEGRNSTSTNSSTRGPRGLGSATIVPVPESVELASISTHSRNTPRSPSNTNADTQSGASADAVVAAVGVAGVVGAGVSGESSTGHVGLNEVQSGNTAADRSAEMGVSISEGNVPPSLALAATAHLHAHPSDIDSVSAVKPGAPPAYTSMPDGDGERQGEDIDNEGESMGVVTTILDENSGYALGMAPPPEILLPSENQENGFSGFVDSPKLAKHNSSSYSQREAVDHLNTHLQDNNIANLDEDAVAVGIDADADSDEGEAAGAANPYGYASPGALNTSQASFSAAGSASPRYGASRDETNANDIGDGSVAVDGNGNYGVFDRVSPSSRSSAHRRTWTQQSADLIPMTEDEVAMADVDADE